MTSARSGSRLVLSGLILVQSLAMLVEPSVGQGQDWGTTLPAGVHTQPFPAASDHVARPWITLAQADQPPQPSPPPTISQPPARPARPAGRRARRVLDGLLADYRTTPARTRLASVPNMYGDTLLRATALSATTPLVPATTVDVPVAGGTRGLKIGDNNKALPVDRIYFTYNHFHNALDAQAALTGTTAAASRSLDRYTLGWEQTFLSGRWSVELRLPLTDGYALNVPAAGVVSASGGKVGNLSIVAKRLVYDDETTALSLGLGIETPTGSDAFVQTDRVRYFIQNDAVHLHPYVAWMQSWDEIFFFHAFLQFDVPTNGSRIDFADVTFDPTGTAGLIDDQMVMYVDIAAGCWVLQNLATLVELHYTTTLQDTDILAGAINASNTPPPTTFRFGNRAGHVDVVNLTVALHTEITPDSTLRVGGVFPLDTDDNRFFDAEFGVQFNYRY